MSVPPPAPAPTRDPARPIVCKFGGTSLAGADQMRKVRDIVAANPARRVIVPSAPGKRTPDDHKITDLLYLCHDAAEQGLSFNEAFGLIADRFRGLVSDLDLDLDLGPLLEEARRGIADAAHDGLGPDYAASRGEALNGRVLAALLRCPCLDAADVIRFDATGRLDTDLTHDVLTAALKGIDRAVIPGFYGSDSDGLIRTFSRGGSDVTGAVVARAVNASVYENWTDVSGLLTTDPRIVDQPAVIDSLTYRELRELSYSGATVLHAEAVFPVRAAGIPVNIRNTNDPDHPGTRIVATENAAPTAYPITGIAGRKDFSVISIEKDLMNEAVGYVERVLAVFSRAGISVEHVPSGIDTLSVVVADAQVKDKLDALMDELRRTIEPDHLDIDPDLALIATVGRNMKTQPGMAAALFGALAKANVNIRMIDQGSGELNIIVGVNARDYETAVRAIYAAFIG